MPDYSDHTHSEARREECGKDRLFLRPPSPTADKLDKLAAKLMTSRSGAAAYAIEQALGSIEGMTERQLTRAIGAVRRLEGVDLRKR